MKLVKYCVKTNGLFMKQTLGFCCRETMKQMKLGESYETSEIGVNAMKQLKLGHKKPNVAVL